MSSHSCRGTGETVGSAQEAPQQTEEMTLERYLMLDKSGEFNFKQAQVLGQVRVVAYGNIPFMKPH